eukprot:3707726-Rhodomonas_salina.2
MSFRHGMPTAVAVQGPQRPSSHHSSALAAGLESASGLSSALPGVLDASVSSTSASRSSLQVRVPDQPSAVASDLVLTGDDKIGGRGLEGGTALESGAELCTPQSPKCTLSATVVPHSLRPTLLEGAEDGLRQPLQPLNHPPPPRHTPNTSPTTAGVEPWHPGGPRELEAALPGAHSPLAPGDRDPQSPPQAPPPTGTTQALMERLQHWRILPVSDSDMTVRHCPPKRQSGPSLPRPPPWSESRSRFGCDHLVTGDPVRCCRVSRCPGPPAAARGRRGEPGPEGRNWFNEIMILGSLSQ